MKTKFLLADDDVDDADLFCEAVLDISPEMQCHTVENGNKLFDLLSNAKSFIPEVIFLDINMPVMNGWEVLRRLRQDLRFEDLPVIMYSTSSAHQDVQKAYDLGASVFLTKPEAFEELREIIKLVSITPIQYLISALRGFSSCHLK